MTYGIIVDGYSSGSELVNEFKKLGVSCIHIQSQKIIPDIYMKTFKITAYIKNYIFDNNIPLLCSDLRSFKPIFAIPGSEPGVELADQIANALKLNNRNPIETSGLRRDKFLMQEQLKKRGLSSIPQFKSRSLNKLLNWSMNYFKNGPLIIKPLKSAGGDKVKICYSQRDLVVGFNTILSLTPNMLGLIDTEALLQKYIDSTGPEIAINTTQYNGITTLCEIWEFHKSECGNGKKIYNYADLKLPCSYDSGLKDYACKIAEVLDIRYGPMHAEILMTQQGPVLIEAAARLMGANIPVDLMYSITHIK